MYRKKDAMRMKIQAIPQKIQATLGTNRRIKGLIESLPSSICMKKVSSFTCIGDIFPMITVLFRTMYDIFISKVQSFLRTTRNAQRGEGDLLRNDNHYDHDESTNSAENLIIEKKESIYYKILKQS